MDRKKKASALPGEFVPSPSWHYETTVANIEAMITEIEAGNLDLAEVFEKFNLAVESLQQCEAFLQERRQQMDILIEQLGNPMDF